MESLRRSISGPPSTTATATRGPAHEPRPASSAPATGDPRPGSAAHAASNA
ncbi:MAG: hypothetical protein L0G70_06475 [Rubrobacter sp.]|nr:hypothetical protein [Rubrobacter sp.]